MTEEIEAEFDRPLLDCPHCGDPLIPASGRGRWDDDGNFVEHREGCRCPWCKWVWCDDAEPVRCKCGALVKVDIDDEHAYSVEMAPSAPSPGDVTPGDACRCGWDGQGEHPCHGRGYTCRAPAQRRMYSLGPAAVAGAQVKMEATFTWACRSCWVEFMNRKVA